MKLHIKSIQIDSFRTGAATTAFDLGNLEEIMMEGG